jgi:hypothetical protein
VVHKTVAKLIVLSFVAITLSACGIFDRKKEKDISSEVDKVIFHLPKNKITRKYTFPGPPIKYACCAYHEFPSEAYHEFPSELQAIFIDKLPVKDRSQSKSPNSAALFSSANPCVKLDSLSFVEKTILFQQSRSCNTFVSHNHRPCSCTIGCGGSSEPVQWVCDCPGIPAGQLPEIKQQNSIRSNYEFVGEILSACSSLPPNL